jgi:hypothetical protein
MANNLGIRIITLQITFRYESEIWVLNRKDNQRL